VYLNRIHEFTVYVTTPKGLWQIKNGRISIIKSAEEVKQADKTVKQK
jgi:hypothetical protein